MIKQFFALALLFALGKALHAQVPFQEKITQAIDKEYEALLSLYQHLHANPELSFQEEKTSKALAQELRKAGFKVTENVGGYGVVGILENGKGPSILIRTDMDALPIKEETEVSFASQVVTKDESGKEVPVMHACAHDMHMAVWAGTARVLSQLKNRWKGTVIFIAQPAEERGAGAKAMIQDGLFENFPRPDYALALHVNSSVAAGKVGYCPSYSMANVDMLDITVKGKGGHGATPHLTIDPVVVASKIVLDLQTIVSREISSLEPAVITVGSIHGGTKGNIIPNEVKMELTLRSFSDETRDQLIEKIKRTCEGIAHASGIPREDYPVVTVRDEFTPSLYNEPALTERMAKVFQKALGDKNVEKVPPAMYGEDFGRYGRETPAIPILMYSLGTIAEKDLETAEKAGTSLPATHSSKYIPDTMPSLKTGILSMSAAVLDLLKK
jgi:amidohydrolase